MANPAKVSNVLRRMNIALKASTLNDTDEKMRVAAFSHPLRNFSDEAVEAACIEWIESEKFMPSVVEFADLVRKHFHRRLDEQRALSPAQQAIQTYPIGKPGREGLAAQIVMLKMMRAVAEQCPQGFWGRLVYGMNDKHASTQPDQIVEDGPTRAQRIKAYAAIAYEQAVDFTNSTLGWERW